MQILVVDDDLIAGEITCAILEDAGHQPHRVENGVEAIDYLVQNINIHLVVSDMNMPLVSGIDLLDTLRQNHFTIPFILLSGDDLGMDAPANNAVFQFLVKDDNLSETLPTAIARMAQ